MPNQNDKAMESILLRIAAVSRLNDITQMVNMPDEVIQQLADSSILFVCGKCDANSFGNAVASARALIPEENQDAYAMLSGFLDRDLLDMETEHPYPVAMDALIVQAVTEYEALKAVEAAAQALVSATGPNLNKMFGDYGLQSALAAIRGGGK